MVETRTVEQVLVWYLVLNPMRGRTEACLYAAWSDDKELLMNWYKSLRVEPYTDGGWHKTFAKGSVLEWYNPMEKEDGTPNWYQQGLHHAWINVEDMPVLHLGYRVTERDLKNNS